MSKSIYPCIWFNGDAREAAMLYCSLFDNSVVKQDTPMVTTFELNGQHFMGLNAGPQFRPNASISFYATIEDKAKLEQIWQSLLEGGKELMPLDKYDWSGQYGWLEDKYGVNWQLSLGKVSEAGQGVVPLLMFCGEQQGKAEAAINYYKEVFPASETVFEARYQPGQTQIDATMVHARFRLDGSLLMAMDSAVPQPFTFSEGVSLVINCDTQEEIDHYWNKLTENGTESMCGWCRDQFGLWWQVVPSILGKLMTNPEKAPGVGAALMKMKKFDIAALEAA